MRTAFKPFLSLLLTLFLLAGSLPATAANPDQQRVTPEQVQKAVRRLQQLYKTGNFKEFRRTLHRIRSLPGEKPPVLHLMEARVLAELGQPEYALQTLERYFEEAPASDQYHGAARLLKEKLLSLGLTPAEPARDSAPVRWDDDEDDDLLPSERDITPGRYFALLIGVESYASDTLQDLRYPIDDAQQLRQILTANYTFDPSDVFLVTNPTRTELITELDRLAKMVGEEDSLLIFYAGHGYWDEQFQQGYWLPSDASRDNRSNWIANGTVRDYIRGITSRHTLLVSDACFSGGIFRTRSAFNEAASAVKTLYQMPSRKAMTSGTMTEVPDRSVFMRYLTNRLESNTDDFLTAEQLFSSFRTAVINNSPLEQVPQFGEIREAGDEGGDFIFVKRSP